MRAKPGAMSREGLDALRRRVHDDPNLAVRLRALQPAEFGAEVLQVAAELECDVAETDLRDAIAEAQRGWQLRWVL